MKSPFNYPSYKKNLDLINLAISDKEFQDEINKAREHLGLKDPKYDLPYNKKIARTFESKTDKILESKDFNDSEKKILMEKNSGKITNATSRERLNILYNQLPINYLNSLSSYLCKKYNLPEHFSEYIIPYIILGTIDAPQQNFKGGVIQGRLKDISSLEIKIFTQLTKEEIKELKKYIDWIGHRLPKHRNFRKMKDQLTFEQYAKDAVFHDYATGEDERVPLTEIAIDKFKSKKKVQKIYDAKRQLKNLRTKRLKVSSGE